MPASAAARQEAADGEVVEGGEAGVFRGARGSRETPWRHPCSVDLLARQCPQQGGGMLRGFLEALWNKLLFHDVMSFTCQCRHYKQLMVTQYACDVGYHVLCRDRAVPEDRSLRQEGWIHSWLCLPAEECDESESRDREAVCDDVGSRRWTSGRCGPGGGLWPAFWFDQFICSLFWFAVSKLHKVELRYPASVGSSIWYALLATQPWSLYDDRVPLADSGCVHGAKPDPAMHRLPPRCAQEQPSSWGRPTNKIAGNESDACPPGWCLLRGGEPPRLVLVSPSAWGIVSSVY